MKLSGIGSEVSGRDAGTSNIDGPIMPSAQARAVAKRIYAARRQRATVMDGQLFSDPAWDMLLDLVVHQGLRLLSVSAVCLGANVPHATALRYLNLLIDEGLIERMPDFVDKRRTHIRLTRGGLVAMEIALTRFA